VFKELISRLTTVAEREIFTLLAATIHAADEILDICSGLAAFNDDLEIIVEDVTNDEVIVARRDHVEKLRREKYDISIPSDARKDVIHLG